MIAARPLVLQSHKPEYGLTLCSIIVRRAKSCRCNTPPFDRIVIIGRSENCPIGVGFQTRKSESTPEPPKSLCNSSGRSFTDTPRSASIGPNSRAALFLSASDAAGGAL